MTELTEAERETLAAAFAGSSRSPHHLAFLAAPAVTAIVAARVASERAGRVRAEAQVAAVEALADRGIPDGWVWKRDIRAALAAVPDPTVPMPDHQDYGDPCTHREAWDAVTEHHRASTEDGPDYCADCSDAVREWVPWPCARSAAIPAPTGAGS